MLLLHADRPILLEQAGLTLNVKDYSGDVGKLGSTLETGLGKEPEEGYRIIPTIRNTHGKITLIAGEPSVKDVAASNGNTGEDSYQVIQILK